MYSFYSFLFGTGLLSLSALSTVIANNQNTANFRKVICTVHDKTLVKNMSCITKPISRHKTVIGTEFFVTRPLHTIMVHARFLKKLNVVYKPFLIDITENVCDAFSNKKPAPYIKLVRALVGSYTNLNHSCPYEGYLRTSNMTLDLSSLKLFMPQGEYRLDLVGYFNKNLLKATTMQAYLEIGEKLLPVK